MEDSSVESKAEKRQIPQYEAIVIMGRGIGKDSKGKWRPQSYFIEGSLQSGTFNNNVDPNNPNVETLINGQNANNLAGYHLYRQLAEQGFPPKLVVFAAGRGDGYLKDAEESLSEGKVIGERFLNKLTGLKDLREPETIIFGKNKTTRDDMRETVRLIKERGLKNVAIITVGVHLKRTHEFFDIFAQKENLDGINVDFIPSEKILIETDPRYKKNLKMLKILRLIKQLNFTKNED